MYCQILESIRIFARLTKNSDIIKKKLKDIQEVFFKGERWTSCFTSHYQFWSLQVKNLVKPNKTQEIEHIYVLDK